MKLLLSLAATLLPLSLHAALKWERTMQVVEWQPGQRDAVVQFPYKNTSKVPQKIVQLKGACTCCTSASASRKNVAPGETGFVRMRVDLSGKTLPTAKAVAVTTDDGEVVSLILQVRTPHGEAVEIPRWNFKR